MTSTSESKFYAVTPRALVSYLRSHGWVQVKVSAQRFSLWHDSAEHPNVEVIVPVSRDSADYILRVDDVVRRLAAFEDRERPALMNDILNAAADLVRVRLAQKGVPPGQVPLPDGAGLAAGTRDMLLAAACTTVERRPFFGSRKPGRAADFLQGVRMGPTEEGSYVLTVVSDLPEAPGMNLGDWSDPHASIPFERRATQTLMEALSAVHRVAAFVRQDGDLTRFGKTVEQGASANLCEALVRALGSQLTTELEISVRWSPVLPAPDLPTKVGFREEERETLTEAAEYLKGVENRVGVLVLGVVEKLERLEDAPLGTVVVKTMSRDLPKHVRMSLGPQAYGEAINAHETGEPIRCMGDLRKQGRSWWLEAPTGFTVLRLKP